MLAADLFSFIEKTAPLKAAAKWDLSGLQVASTRKYIFNLGVCLDPLPGTIQLALEKGADCILSHHPLSLAPGLPNKIDKYYETLKLLLAANIPLYAAHTSLDANPDGPAFWLARELGLTNLKLLELTHQPEADFPNGFGFGAVGDLPAPMSKEDVISKILELCHLREAFLCGAPIDGDIGRIAFCGGSGSSMCSLAAAAGARLYITGDMKYHAALDAEIPVLDVGHFSMEEEMMRRFSQYLAKKLEIGVEFIPWHSPFRLVKA